MKRTPEELFDARFYLRSAGPLDPGATPWEHYRTSGWRRGVNPHPLFDVAWYRSLSQADCEPFQHYFDIGWRRGVMPHPLFDTAYYVAENSGVSFRELNPLVHFLEIGGFEGRDPNPEFSCEGYLAGHPELRALGINPLVHSILNAWRIAA